VVSLDAEGTIREAKELSSLSPHVVVKIPIMKEGLKAIRTVSQLGIRVNCTLNFSANQALLAARAGAAYVSPFLGRLDDIGNEGMQIVRDIVQIFRNYDEIKTQVIAASIRNPIHVIEAAKAGADVATIPFSVIEQMLKHPLTDIGIQRFSDDWKKSGISFG
jgi:transaldolase